MSNWCTVFVSTSVCCSCISSSSSLVFLCPFLKSALLLGLRYGPKGFSSSSALPCRIFMFLQNFHRKIFVFVANTEKEMKIQILQKIKHKYKEGWWAVMGPGSVWCLHPWSALIGGNFHKKDICPHCKYRNK